MSKTRQAKGLSRHSVTRTRWRIRWWLGAALVAFMFWLSGAARHAWVHHGIAAASQATQIQGDQQLLSASAAPLLTKAEVKQAIAVRLGAMRQRYETWKGQRRDELAASFALNATTAAVAIPRAPEVPVLPDEVEIEIAPVGPPAE